jgi:L-iditol 2-dehydrogenase
MMPITASVAVWDGQAMSLRRANLPASETSTLIEVVAAGLCGTDLHVMQHTKMGTDDAPLSLGHEIIGRILRKGADLPAVSAAEVSEGDLVVVVPGVACGRCAICMSFGSHEHLCPHRVVHGFSAYRPDEFFAIGGYATHIELASDIAVAKVPEGMAWSRAVLAEMVSIAVRAAERGLGQGRPDLGMGSLVSASAAVLGLGPVGSAVALVLQALGLRVTGFEVNPWRAAHAARRLGIDARLISGESGDWIQDGLRETSAGLGFDVVMECGGAAELLSHAIVLARPGGRVVELGNFISSGSAPIDPSLICRKDLEVVGSVLAPAAVYPKALHLLGREDIPFGELVTQTLTLEEVSSQDLLGERTYMKRVVLPGAA